MRVLGRKIGIFTDGTSVGYSTGCALHVSGDKIEMASLGSMAKSFKAGRYTFTLDVDALFDGSAKGAAMQAKLLSSLTQGTELSFVMSEVQLVDGGLVIDEEATMTFSGQVLVSNFDINAPANGYANLRVAFQGTGELIVTTNEAEG